MSTRGLKNNIKNKRVAILGPGAIGGFLAALFWHNGIDVVCIARESAKKIISKEGIRLESSFFGNFTARPKVITRLNFKPDMLFITTKAISLKQALARVKPKFISNAVIIPLLNGIEHMQLLRSRYGKHVIAASIGSIEVKRVSASHIIHTTASAMIKMASRDNLARKRINEAAKLLSYIGVKTEVLKTEADVLWEKLVRLGAMACTTAASKKTVGQVRSQKAWRKQLLQCVQEAVAVASAEGATVNTDDAMAKIDSIPFDVTTSTQRDIALGNPSELDAVAGSIVRIGSRHNLRCPTIERIINEIQAKKI
ncbi:MAG: 2-dehydropantoate 2-reductase [Candidatus Omnitrophota bacterium]